MSKKTAILGASPNPNRYAFLAAERLSASQHEFVPIGIKKGDVLGNQILNLKERPKVEDVDTVTMYIGPQNQAEWESYILSLKPNRIIFNPGSENPSLAQKATEAGIQTMNACTLVMIASGMY